MIRGLTRQIRAFVGVFTLSWKRVLLSASDMVAINLSVAAALWLRFEGGVPAAYWEFYGYTAPYITVIVVLTFYGFGLYNRVWEYASLEAVSVIARAVAVAGLISTLFLALQGSLYYPRSVWIVTWVFLFFIVGGSRLLWRAASIRKARALHSRRDQRRLLIYGSGPQGMMLAQESQADPEGRCKVVGFIDDDPDLVGMYAGGLRVHGTSHDVERVARRLGVRDIAVASPDTAPEDLERVTDVAAAMGIRVRTVPRMLELIDGRATLPQLRDIDAADLIGRPARCSDLTLPNDYISGRTVLVTGAGGSIGSEICRQLCRYRPKRIVLLGRGENRIHSIYYELRDAFPHIQFEPVIANITSATAVADVLSRFSPHAVFHAAAHKHVFLMETNPTEAAINNIIGTSVLVDLAEAYGVERFVMLSTDKAAEPTCVMGATKAFCERLVAHKNAHSTGTKLMSVRFGNVLGSNGSVVPIFSALAEADKPLTVTHPETDRFFMTIPEASFLVLQAGALGQGGEVFVLDMGDPVKIVDIARTILKMHGKDPDAPEAIRFIGLRTGEKLHETLVSFYEELAATSCVQILQVVPVEEKIPALMDLEQALAAVSSAVQEYDDERLIEVLAEATGAEFFNRWAKRKLPEDEVAQSEE